MRFLIITVVLIYISLPSDTGSGKNAYPKNASYNASKSYDYLPNIIVVKFSQDVFVAKKTAKSGNVEIDRLLQKYNVQYIHRMLKSDKLIQKSKFLNNVFFIEYNGDITPGFLASEFEKIPNIVYAEPIRKHYLYEIPNDPYYHIQELYYYEKIKAADAWEMTKGEDGNVLIAIVDGGTDISHEDLSGNLWINPGEIPDNGIDDDDNGFIDDVHGWNFANKSGNPKGLEETPENAFHGTHVAGITSAVSNNEIGIAGASWNAKIMAINTSCSEEDGCIAYGYEGIIYAAYNGADIINCSWGHSGDKYRWEQDVINEAVAQGAVVVCAAGNDNSSEANYPSSYENAFSVATTTSNDDKASFSNYGITIDVAAPGEDLLSTIPGGGYDYARGTSMSAPLTAGIIGLVKTQNPTWSNSQAAEQVRVTANELPSFPYILGKGRINAYRALTESLPSIRISGADYYDSGGDGIIHPRENVQVYLKLLNYLFPASNVELTASTTNEYITIQNEYITLSSIGRMQEVILSSPFIIEVSEEAPPGIEVVFNLYIKSGDYEDIDYFTIPIQPIDHTLDVNNIEVTVTNIGRIGFAVLDDVWGNKNGIGFRYQHGPNLLLEGALILGTDLSQLSNASRGIETEEGRLTFDQDFIVSDNGDLRFKTQGSVSDQETIGIFEDSNADNPMNIQITQETYASTDPAYDDFIIFKYKVKNLSADQLTNFHFGLFFDWDIPPGIFANVTKYDTGRKMGYSYDTTMVTAYAGVSALNEGDVSYHAIYNNQNNPDNPSWGIWDGFTDEEKWESISCGTDHNYLTAGPADISFVIASGPITIESQGTAVIGFAMIAASDSANLMNHADAAQSFWDQVVVLDIENNMREKIPADFSLKQNYPNPFNPITSIEFSLPKAEFVTLKIYNTLGQEISTLVRDKLNAGNHKVEWNAKDMASGVYYYRLQAGEFVDAKKLILLK